VPPASAVNNAGGKEKEMAKAKKAQEFGDNTLTEERAAEAADEAIRDLVEVQRRIDGIMERARDEAASFRDEIKDIKKRIRKDYGQTAKAVSVAAQHAINRMRSEVRIQRLKPDVRRQAVLMLRKQPQLDLFAVIGETDGGAAKNVVPMERKQD
jgi:hypothetical protein